MSGLRTDYPIDRLRMVHEALAAFNSEPSENPELGDALETLEAIASALYGAEVYADPDTARDDGPIVEGGPLSDNPLPDGYYSTRDLARDDAIDAAHADPELNAVADLRTDASGETGAYGDPCALENMAPRILALCDAYIGLRAQCPRGAVVVTAPQLGNLGPVRYTDDNGDPTTLFDKVVGALDFSEVYAQIIEVK